MELSEGRSSHEVGQTKFVHNYFKRSRLHFIGTWKIRYRTLLNENKPKLANVAFDPKTFGKFGEKIVFHVDMDAFFASVSLRYRPELKELPVVICHGEGPNAEISCANYPARNFGIKAGMLFGSARELCSHVQSLPYDFDNYILVAESMYKELFRISGKVLGMSCDEAYCDVSCYIYQKMQANASFSLFDTCLEVAEELRERIHVATGGCTASVGIGNSKLIAKIATSSAKPNGCKIIDIASDQTPILELKLSDVPGIGYRTMRGLRTDYPDLEQCKDLVPLPTSTLENIFGSKLGTTLYHICRGVIKDSEWTEKPQKELSVQISWGVRMQVLQEVFEFIDALCVELMKHMKACNVPTGFCRIGMTVWKAREDADPNKRKGFLGHGQCNFFASTVDTKSPLAKLEHVQSEAKKIFESLSKSHTITPQSVRGFKLNCSKFVDPSNSIKTFFARQEPGARVQMDALEYAELLTAATVPSSKSPIKISSQVSRVFDDEDDEDDDVSICDIVQSQTACEDDPEVISISSQDSGEIEVVSSKRTPMTIDTMYHTMKEKLDQAFQPSGKRKRNGIECQGILCTKECSDGACQLRRRLCDVSHALLEFCHALSPPQNLELAEACKAYCESTWDSLYFVDQCHIIMQELVARSL